MQERLHHAINRVKQNPVLQKSLKSIKPEASLWGMISIFLFFILPEIIDFGWGKEIAQWAHNDGLVSPYEIVRMNDWILEKLFEDGGSWINLSIGLLLFGWVALDYFKKRREDIK